MIDQGGVKSGAGRGFFLVIMLVSALIALAIIVFYRAWLLPDYEFEAILDGDETISVRSITISAIARVTVNDPDAMDYLAKAFRSAEKHKGFHGRASYMTITLSTGRATRCGIDLSNREDEMTISFPVDSIGDDMRTYFVVFPQPMPKSLSAALRNFR